MDPESEALIASYKDIIRSQATELQALNSKVAELSDQAARAEEEATAAKAEAAAASAAAARIPVRMVVSCVLTLRLTASMFLDGAYRRLLLLRQ